MTFKELYETVRREVSGVYAIEVVCWNHKHGCDTEWKIWVAAHQEHYCGATPEEALRVLREGSEEKPTPTLDEVSAAVAELPGADE